MEHSHLQSFSDKCVEHNIRTVARAYFQQNAEILIKVALAPLTAASLILPRGKKGLADYPQL